MDARGGRLGSRHAVALQLMVRCGTAPLPSFTRPQPLIFIATMGGCPCSWPKALAETPSKAIAAITLLMTSHRMVAIVPRCGVSVKVSPVGAEIEAPGCFQTRAPSAGPVFRNDPRAEATFCRGGSCVCPC